MSQNAERMQKAFDYVDRHFDEMLADLKEACAAPSVRGNAEGLEAVRRRIVDKMESLGLAPRLHPVQDGNALISGSIGEGGETLLFYNHYDVVEPGRRENWSIPDPFDAQIADGKMIARGVSDNKGALYSRLHAVQALRAAGGWELPVGAKFLFEGDEETSSPSMHRFAQEKPDAFREMTKADACVWENGSNDDAGHTRLRMGVRGSAAFDLRATTANSDVHGRMGATIPSASWRLVWALSSLKGPDERIAIDGFYDRVLHATPADLEVLRDFPYDEETQKKKLDFSAYLCGATGDELKRRVYLEPSISICGLEAGEVHDGVRGIVPHTAYARVSFYLVADQDPVELERLLRRHLDKHGFADIELTLQGGVDRPVRTPVDIPFRYRACEAAKKVFGSPQFGEPMVIELTQLGAGPASVLRDAWPSLPIVGFGPANTAGNHHAPDENIRLDDYKNAVKYLIALFCSYEK